MVILPVILRFPTSLFRSSSAGFWLVTTALTSTLSLALAISLTPNAQAQVIIGGDQTQPAVQTFPLQGTLPNPNAWPYNVKAPKRKALAAAPDPSTLPSRQVNPKLLEVARLQQSGLTATDAQLAVDQPAPLPVAPELASVQPVTPYQAPVAPPIIAAAPVATPVMAPVYAEAAPEQAAPSAQLADVAPPAALRDIAPPAALAENAVTNSLTPIDEAPAPQAAPVSQVTATNDGAPIVVPAAQPAEARPLFGGGTRVAAANTPALADEAPAPIAVPAQPVASAPVTQDEAPPAPPAVVTPIAPLTSLGSAPRLLAHVGDSSRGTVEKPIAVEPTAAPEAAPEQISEQTSGQTPEKNPEKTPEPQVVAALPSRDDNAAPSPAVVTPQPDTAPPPPVDQPEAPAVAQPARRSFFDRMFGGSATAEAAKPVTAPALVEPADAPPVAAPAPMVEEPAVIAPEPAAITVPSEPEPVVAPVVVAPAVVVPSEPEAVAAAPAEKPVEKPVEKPAPATVTTPARPRSFFDRMFGTGSTKEVAAPAPLPVPEAAPTPAPEPVEAPTPVAAPATPVVMAPPAPAAEPIPEPAPEPVAVQTAAPVAAPEASSNLTLRDEAATTPAVPSETQPVAQSDNQPGFFGRLFNGDKTRTVEAPVLKPITPVVIDAPAAEPVAEPVAEVAPAPVVVAAPPPAVPAPQPAPEPVAVVAPEPIAVVAPTSVPVVVAQPVAVTRDPEPVVVTPVVVTPVAAPVAEPAIIVPVAVTPVTPMTSNLTLQQDASDVAPDTAPVPAVVVAPVARAAPEQPGFFGRLFTTDKPAASQPAPVAAPTTVASNPAMLPPADIVPVASTTTSVETVTPLTPLAETPTNIALVPVSVVPETVDLATPPIVQPAPVAAPMPATQLQTVPAFRIEAPASATGGLATPRLVPAGTQVAPAASIVAPAAATAPAASFRNADTTPTAQIDFLPASQNIDSVGQAQLQAIAEALRLNSSARLLLNAYADSSTVAESRRISLNRALVVRTKLAELGIQPARIDVQSLGQDRPSGVDGSRDRVDAILR